MFYFPSNFHKSFCNISGCVYSKAGKYNIIYKKTGDPMHMKKISISFLMVLAMTLLSASSNALAQVNLNSHTTTDITVFNSSIADYQTYLPIVQREPVGFILFPNGDFEQGPVIWEEYSSNGYPLIVQQLAPGVEPYDGTWAAWLGGAYDEISYIVQQVAVPNDLPFMSYWHWIVSSDDCGKDIAEVLVNDVVVDTYSLCSANNTGGWVKHVVDLNAYAGDTVYIKINAACDGSKNSNLFIDTVGFQLTPLENNSIIK
jgi:hypothetical protein